MWQYVKLSDVSLGTRPRYSLVVDEDVKKTNKETNTTPVATWSSLSPEKENHFITYKMYHLTEAILKENATRAEVIKEAKGKMKQDATEGKHGCNAVDSSHS